MTYIISSEIAILKGVNVNAMTGTDETTTKEKTGRKWIAKSKVYSRSDKTYGQIGYES